MFFRKKEICFHEWKLVDYNNHVSAYLEICEKYEIGCPKCNRTKTVDKYAYSKMKSQGLIS